MSYPNRPISRNELPSFERNRPGITQDRINEKLSALIEKADRISEKLRNDDANLFILDFHQQNIDQCCVCNVCAKLKDRFNYLVQIINNLVEHNICFKKRSSKNECIRFK
jgi:hypothetical protein